MILTERKDKERSKTDKANETGERQRTTSRQRPAELKRERARHSERASTNTFFEFPQERSGTLLDETEPLVGTTHVLYLLISHSTLAAVHL